MIDYIYFGISKIILKMVTVSIKKNCGVYNNIAII